MEMALFEVTDVFLSVLRISRAKSENTFTMKVVFKEGASVNFTTWKFELAISLACVSAT